MNKSMKLSLVTAVLLAGNVFAGGGIEVAGGKLTGDARVAYDSHTTAEYGTHEEHAVNALGFGFNPTFSIEPVENLTIEIGAGVAVPLSENEDTAATEFAFGKLNDDGDASEAYMLINKFNVGYSFGSGDIKVGAQDLAMPFFDGDDIRLVPNTFSAVVANYTGVKDLTITFAHVMQMAGAVDGGADDSHEFNSMSTQAFGTAGIDDKPVTSIAAAYGSEDLGLNTQLWYLTMDEPVDGLGAVNAMYFDIGKKFGAVNVTAQYVSYATDLQQNSTTGLMAEAELGDFGLVAAINNYSFTDDGVGAMAAPAYYSWGGYPEFVAGEEVDASDADWDGGSGTLIGASYNGVEHLELSLAYITYSDVKNVIDVVASYGIGEHIHLGAVYETVDVEDDEHDGDQSVVKLHASYSF